MTFEHRRYLATDMAAEAEQYSMMQMLVAQAKIKTIEY